MNATIRIVVGVVLSAAIGEGALAQQTPSASTFKLRDGTVDLAVPESPAFSALGLTPQEVTRPTTGRELATSLLNGVDRDGNFQTGIAIDTAPYMLLAGSKITLKKYQERGQYLTRFLARWQTSFATAKGGSSEDKSAKVALGLRFTLFDRGDPRTDSALLTCLAREADNVLNNQPPVPPGSDVEIENRKREEAVRTAVKPCRDAAAKRRWNRSAWVIGAAPTWTSADGKTSDVAYGGSALWSSLGYGFEGVPELQEHAMVALYAKGRNKETVPDAFNQGAFITQNNLTIGSRLLVGASSTQFNVEGLYLRNNRADKVEDKYWHLNFGFEQRLIENTWLNLSFGRELSRGADNKFSVIGSFNWGFGAK